MAHGNEPNDRNRPTKVHQLSATGGVLHIPQALEESANVELLFQVGRTTVRNRAQMLGPIWATKGCLQPFRFTDLNEYERQGLQDDLAGFLDTGSGKRHN